jgi:hypothetical protein
MAFLVYLGAPYAFIDIWIKYKKKIFKKKNDLLASNAYSPCPTVDKNHTWKVF